MKRTNKKPGNFKFWVIFCILAISVLSGCSSNSSQSGRTDVATKGTEDNPLILGISPMASPYSWEGLDELGYFEKNNIYVKIQYFAVYSDLMSAFNSGNIDAIPMTASDTIAPYTQGVKFKIVMINDCSAGADAIIAKDEINSIKDLKGKTVATEVGTIEEMFLLKALENNGMTIEDINFVNMTINEAGPAFISGKLDAAVLFEPTLTMALQDGGGHIVYSSKETPGMIPDVIAVRQEVIDNAPETVQKFVDTWYNGINVITQKDEQFLQAVCQKAELEKDDFVSMLDGVTIFDEKMNINAFKSGNDYSSLEYVLQESSQFLYDTKVLSQKIDDVSNIIDNRFVNGEFR